MEIKVRWKMLYVVAASLLLLMLQLAAAHSLSSPYHTSHEVIFSASHFSVWMERISIWFAPFVTIADIFYQSTYIFYHHDGDGSRNSFFFFFSLYFCIHVVAVVVRDVCARSRVCVCVSIQRLCRLILLKEVGFVIVIHNRQKLLQITVNAHSSKHSRLFIFIYNIRMAGEKGYALAFAFDLMVKLFFFCCVASSLSSSVPAIESIYYGRFVSMTSAPHNRTPLA